jgi:7,8-dihydropterin-6-yl-methyl-4-(beta-D-ribofuranosyl)aminobenzene 5'-phosphate synthase
MRKTGLNSLLISAVFLAASLVFAAARQAVANREIAAEWQSVPAMIPQLAVTSRLEIIPLYEEASAGAPTVSGHGVSYLIRTDSVTILLDVGDNPGKLATPPFASNMRALGIGWDEIDRIVISHLHPDHVGGTDAWQRKTISFGELPGGMGDRLVFVPAKVAYPGAVHATIPTLPGPDVATTGVISYAEVFPLSLAEPKGNEQALVVHVAGQGLVLITGCGHPGLEKLVERAETLYGYQVIGVVGGLHYGESSAQAVEPQIQFLQSRQVKLVALSPHDSGSQALDAFRGAFPQAYQEVRVGSVIRFSSQD